MTLQEFFDSNSNESPTISPTEFSEYVEGDLDKAGVDYIRSDMTDNKATRHPKFFMDGQMVDIKVCHHIFIGDSIRSSV
jgi:hypothetical protein